MLSSDEESEIRPAGRDRSRSPVASRSEESDDERLSPHSDKIIKMVGRLIAKELAPIKKNLSKNLDTTTQVKSTVDQVKRGLAEVKMSQANIDNHLKKAKKTDPKSAMTSYQVTKINATVFEHMKKENKKDEVVNCVFQELLQREIVVASDEDSVKAVASTEFSHLKSHLRNLVSQDLAVGNSVDFPKSVRYLKKHLQDQSLSENTQEFLTIMGLCLVKYENLKPVPMTDSDKQNKKKIDTHVDFYWMWTQRKYEKFQERGESNGEKLKSILLSCGYQAKKGEGAVRRAVLN